MFIIFSTLGYIIGQRYSDSDEEKLLKKTPWFKPGTFFFNTPIWQDSQFADWPQLDYSTGIKDYSKKA